MSEEILMSCNQLESQIAICNAGVVRDIFIERHHHLSMVGNIYLGVVVRVLSGMQAAFVDIGESRTAFLHVNDMQNSTTKLNKTVSKKPIQQQLRQGECILVQVIKAPIGDKGARLTTKITLSSHYLAYLPTEKTSVGVSQKIKNHNTKTYLKTTLQKLIEDSYLSGAVIARTAAQAAKQSSLQKDLGDLLELWQSILQRQTLLKKENKGVLLYQELDLPLRCLRDFVNECTQKIVVDDEKTFNKVSAFVGEFMPNQALSIEYYTNKRPLFETYGVTEKLKSALQRRVNLKSGGYLIIDQTEAMTVIDVNTGAFVKGSTLEEVAYQTNLEAAYAIADQLRLRDIGGIIMIDFIDMNQSKHQADVLAALKQKLALDSAKTQIGQVSEFGLVEVTRERIQVSLTKQLCESCAACQGRGYLKSRETVCLEIVREILRGAKAYPKCQKITVMAQADVIAYFLTLNKEVMADLAELLACKIDCQVNDVYTQEQYHVFFD